MEMRASEDVGIGEDLTTPLPPLAFALRDSSLHSHCSACFSPLSPPPPQFPPLPHTSVLYCSPQCSKADADLHLSSAEHHLLHSDLAAPLYAAEDTSDLRTALRLLRRFELLNLIPSGTDRLERIGGLMSNRDKLTSCRNEEEEDGDVIARIRYGAAAMKMARRMRDGLVLESSEVCVLEEVVLCVVLTNAVEVQVNVGPTVGIAVYDTTFSWINHSCSPNACYYFSLQNCSRGDSRLRIVHTVMGRGGRSGEVEGRESSDCNSSESTKVGEEYGPRIVVRSIKTISKREEVSVAYTDLLQPKARRESELWLKYCFICSCQRCSARPPTYVDHTLQDISAVNCNCANLCSDQNFYIDEAIKRSSDYVEDTITEYLKFGNPKSCCEMLENLLTHGLLDGQFEPKEEKPKHQFWLHPLHHLALSAYTALASAYKTHASDLLAPDPDKDELQLEAFNMSRTSAAYSFLLAAATHHLFLFETSLIAAVANFWTSAGESLLNIARSPVWELLTKGGLTMADLSASTSYKCFKCALADKFETNFSFSQSQNVVFEDISREFLNCITSITPKVWTFLTHQGCYLKLIKDPIDFKWVGTMKSFETSSFKANSGDETWMCVNEEYINLFQLGVHCLLYGGILSSICCGKQSHLARYIQNLLCC